MHFSPDSVFSTRDTPMPNVPRTASISSELIFTPKDIFATSHKFDQLIRALMVKKNVTYRMFISRYREYAFIIGDDPEKITTSRNNLLRALRSGNITLMRFQRTLAVLGYEWVDVTVRVVPTDKDHEQYEDYNLGEMLRTFATQTL